MFIYGTFDSRCEHIPVPGGCVDRQEVDTSRARRAQADCPSAEPSSDEISRAGAERKRAEWQKTQLYIVIMYVRIYA